MLRCYALVLLSWTAFIPGSLAVRAHGSKQLFEVSDENAKNNNEMVLYSINFGNYRKELTSSLRDKLSSISTQNGIPGYFFTDQDFEAPNGWTVVKVDPLSAIDGLTYARRSTKSLKFKGHAVLKPYRYWIHVDSNMHTLNDLGEMLSKGLTSYVKCHTEASLFIRPHPRRTTIEQEMLVLKPGPHGSAKHEFQSAQWQAWNQYLAPRYKTLNTIPLIWGSLFVLDTFDKHMMASWTEIDDVIEKYGIARDQVVYALAMEKDVSKVNYLKVEDMSPICQ